MSCTIYHPFRVRFAVKARRDADYIALTRTTDLVALACSRSNQALATVSAVNCLPGERAEIELCCEQGQSVEKEFGAVAAELEKHGWEVTGL